MVTLLVLARDLHLDQDDQELCCFFSLGALGSAMLGVRYHHSMVSLFYSPQTFYKIYFGYTSCFINVDFTCEVAEEASNFMGCFSVK